MPGPERLEEIIVEGTRTYAEPIRVPEYDPFRAPPERFPEVPPAVEPEPIPEVELTARRPPPDGPNFSWRGQTGPREVWEQLFREYPELADELKYETEAQENALWDDAVRKAKGDIVKARQLFRKMLAKAGYAIEEIAAVLARVEGVALRTAATVAPTLTEIVVSAARTPVARVAASGPAAFATGIVEGGFRLFNWLSGRALDNQLRRFNERAPPPATAPAPPRPAPRPPSRPAAPRTPLVAPLPLDEIIVQAPRPTPRAPISAPAPLLTFGGSPAPLGFSSPGLGGSPFSATPTSLLTPFEGSPLGSPRTTPRPLALPAPVSTPSDPRCDCSKPKKKRKKRKPRDICYRGTYVEKRNGLSKRRRERIPCE